MSEYGLKERALPFVKVDAGLEELSSAIELPGPVIERFKEAAHKVTPEGTEVIIPACGLMNLLLIKEKVREVDGALILDGYAMVLKFAEAMIRLYRDIGLTMSKRLSYASPSKEQVREILNTYMYR